MENGILSHAKLENNTLQDAIDLAIQRVKQRGDLPYITVSKQIDYIDQLSEFDFGKFLLERGGLNGYWTHFVVTHPKRGRISGLNSENKSFHPLEIYLLNHSPAALATQQRYEIFKKEIQKRVQEGCHMASIPSGLMGEFLELDFSKIKDFSLTGIDLDPEAISQGNELAKEKGLYENSQFVQKDAWKLDIQNQFDLISSNGLSIYETEEDRVIQLYREFFYALKDGGYLVTSFLTPPPIPGVKTEWNMEKVNPQDAFLQKILFADILQGKWQVYRSEETVKSQLLKAGFVETEVLYDDAHIFPTILARKPL